jgi:hypothetical protein
MAMAGNNSLLVRDQRTPLRADLQLSAQLYRQMMHLPPINEIRKNRQQAAFRVRLRLAAPGRGLQAGVLRSNMAPTSNSPAPHFDKRLQIGMCYINASFE